MHVPDESMRKHHLRKYQQYLRKILLNQGHFSPRPDKNDNSRADKFFPLYQLFLLVFTVHQHTEESLHYRIVLV